MTHPKADRTGRPLRLAAALSAGLSTLVLAACMHVTVEDSSPSPTPIAAPAAAPLAAAAPSSPEIAAIKALKLDIPYTKYTLKNGLTLLVHEDHKVPTVTVHVWYHVGSKNEPKGRSGFAHLFEHLMFNGSEHFNDDFFKATQKIGATGQNGSTNTDRTNYFQTVPKEGLDTILWLESDRMGYLLGAVDQARLDEQRGVVQNEKRQGENQPYGTVFNHIVKATYPEEHPYGHTVIGSMEDLNAAKLDDVRDWFRTWYGPSNAIMVIAGDITPEEAKAKVEKFFGEIPPGPPVSHPKSWINKLTGKTREVMYDRVAAPRLYWTWNIPELGHPEGELLDVVAYALAGDKNARLTKRLVHDEQVAVGVVAGAGQSELAGQFRIVVTAKPDADLAHIEAVVDEELAKLMTEGPTRTEVEKLQVQTIADTVGQLERASSKAPLLAVWETYTGDGNGWKASIERLEAATPAAVAAATKKWLSDGSYLLTVKPFGDFIASETPVDRTKMPTLPPVADAAFPGFKRATLSNGVKVLLAERHDTPQLTVSMRIDTGYPADFASSDPGVGPLAMNLLDEGTTTRSGLEIAEQLDRLGAGLASVGGGDTSTVEMHALTGTLDPVLAIWADVIRNPAFTESDFKRLQAQTIQGIRQQQRDPNAIAQRVMSRMMWGADHPYGRIATPEDIAAIKREDLAAFHKRWFGPNHATLIVVGDTTLEAITPKLEAALKDWAPAPGASVDVAPVSRAGKPTVYLVDRPDSMQSVILAGAPIAKRNYLEDPQYNAFNALFGGNFTSRINMNLREKHGWSYGSRSAISGGKGPRSFIVTAPVQTDATKGALVELNKELRGVVGVSPPSQSELDIVRTNTLLGQAGRWESAGAVAGALSDIDLNGLPDDYYQTYATRYRAVNVEDVRAVAKTLVPDQNWIWVIVGDRAKIEAGVREAKLGDIIIVDPNGEPVK